VLRALRKLHEREGPYRTVRLIILVDHLVDFLEHPNCLATVTRTDDHLIAHYVDLNPAMFTLLSCAKLACLSVEPCASQRVLDEVNQATF